MREETNNIYYSGCVMQKCIHMTHIYLFVLPDLIIKRRVINDEKNCCQMLNLSKDLTILRV